MMTMATEVAASTVKTMMAMATKIMVRKKNKKVKQKKKKKKKKKKKVKKKKKWLQVKPHELRLLTLALPSSWLGPTTLSTCVRCGNSDPTKIRMNSATSV